MNKIRTCFVLAVTMLLIGCTGHQQLTTQSLIGRWESDVRPTEWGKAKTRFVFGADGRLKISSIFTEELPPKELTNDGSYRVVDHILITDPDLLNKGKPVHIWFDHGDLLVKINDEVPIRLHRIP